MKLTIMHRPAERSHTQPKINKKEMRILLLNIHNTLYLEIAHTNSTICFVNLYNVHD